MLRKVLGLFLAAVTIMAGMLDVYAENQNNPKKVYTFGIVPQQSASRLAEQWGPLLEYLSDKSGIELRFKTAPSIPEFEKRFTRGDYDFSYMNPYHYVVASESPGYQAFAKVADKKIRGIFIVRKDSEISNLEGLSGATLAFPSPAAFAASILPRSELKNRGINFTPKYVNSHDSVYRGVVTGLFPSGGGIVRTFNLVNPDVRDKLKVLWKTPGYTPHAFAAHPRVPDDIVKRLRAAMIEMGDYERGRTLLNVLGMKKLEAAKDGDWDDIRQLNIQELDN